MVRKKNNTPSTCFHHYHVSLFQVWFKVVECGMFCVPKATGGLSNVS